ncbi:MAG: autotransporter-associated N-terminal domain-containing protein, partial [Leptotrichiaceae bacterium]|nr:autotransporter-associated N-terminal domain-containing protein [Leptotrichiaceae bacterium]
MRNILKKMEKDLRALAKRCKDVKYTKALLLSFLLTGTAAFSEGLVSHEIKNTENEINRTRKELNISIKDMNTAFKQAKRENNKLLKNANLELIQLMEQGDQVVKSPWSSWQFGMNYFYGNWRGTYKGRGDKAEKYPYEGVFKRGEWWERNVSPDSVAYDRLQLSTDPSSSLSNKRNGLNYGLVTTKNVKDAGVPFIVEPVISIITPPIPNLNINPVVVNPNVKFTIPDVTTVTFKEVVVGKVEPNIFEPPALNEVSSGFAQGDPVGVDKHFNYIISNGDVKITDPVLKIRVDEENYYREGGFEFSGKNDSLQRLNPPRTVEVTKTGNGIGVFNEPYLVGKPANSPQTLVNVLTDSFKIDGNIEFRNNTLSPATSDSSGLRSTNTVRVISVNHAYGRVDKTTEFNLNGDVTIYGRDGYGDPIVDVRGTRRYNNKPHMTIGIEHQAYGSIGARAINNGTMILSKESAKDGSKLATNLVGMTAMIEDYSDFRHVTPNTVPGFNANANSDSPLGWYLSGTSADNTGVTDVNWGTRRQAPWESTLENRGKIIVNAIDSIGMDFAQYTFTDDLTNYKRNLNPTASQAKLPTGNPSYNNKGSLNVYARVGNIEINSEDPAHIPGIQGSYGLRVPNIFISYTNSHVYYDETVIDGTGGNINVNGSHNVGTSISKIITGSERVRKYQAGELTAQPVDGSKPYLTARPDTDPIGNIYKLNILVNGTENIGILKKSDYMEGTKYYGNGLSRAKNDFVITDSHVEKIDFSKDAKGGVLFRTDKYGMDLAKNNFTVTEMENRNRDASGNDMFNIVMLGNGTKNSVTAGASASLNLDPSKPVKVKNSMPITIGTAANTGYNMIGLMAYNGAEIENNADITLNTKNSLALVIDGTGTRGAATKESSGSSNNSNITVTGDNSIGVYNNGRTYRMTGGSISTSGIENVGIYSAGIPIYDAFGNITGYSKLATTSLNNGTLKVDGAGSVGIFANGGSDIELNNMTNMEVKENALLFYGIGFKDTSGITDYSQLKLNGNNSATIRKGGVAFYLKENTLNNIRENSTNGRIDLTLEDDAVLSVIEGTGGNTPLSTTQYLTGGLGSGLLKGAEIAPGIFINANSGNYIRTKATRVHLILNGDSNLDDPVDVYLNSEFSSSSITVEAGKTISGTGSLTAPAKL